MRPPAIISLLGILLCSIPERECAGASEPTGIHLPLLSEGRLRAAASFSSPALAVLPAGTVVEVLSRDGLYYQVAAADTLGFVVFAIVPQDARLASVPALTEYVRRSAPPSPGPMATLDRDPTAAAAEPAQSEAAAVVAASIPSDDIPSDDAAVDPPLVAPVDFAPGSEAPGGAPTEPANETIVASGAPSDPATESADLDAEVAQSEMTSPEIVTSEGESDVAITPTPIKTPIESPIVPALLETAGGEFVEPATATRTETASLPEAAALVEESAPAPTEPLVEATLASATTVPIAESAVAQETAEPVAEDAAAPEMTEPVAESTVVIQPITPLAEAIPPRAPHVAEPAPEMSARDVARDEPASPTSVEVDTGWTKADRSAELVALYGQPIASRLIAGDVWVGMTAEMAREVLGQPIRVHRTVTTHLEHEMWVFTGTYLYLDNDVVTGWQGSSR